MSLSNYTELLAGVTDWLDRPDVAARVPDFITLAEAHFNRVLRMRAQVVYVHGETDQPRLSVPAGFLEMLRLHVNGQRVPLDYHSITDLLLLQMDPNMEGKPPAAYAITSNAIELGPAPSGVTTFNMVYFQRIPALASAEGGVNWLLTEHPDVYLYGALAQSAPFIKNDERLATWNSLFTGAIESAQGADTRSVSRGSRLHSNPSLVIG